MTRLAADRDTHLTAAEIAAEALRQFDAGPGDPSIRSLAAALHVAPTAIYHHFPSRAAIYQAAVVLAWGEAVAMTLDLVGDPLAADPADVLVAVALATRRTWLAHYRLARYMAATPEADEFTTNALSTMAFLFERMGLHGEDAAAAFHTYAGFMIGAVLFAADRRAANEQLTRRVGQAGGQGYRATHVDPVARLSGDSTLSAIDRVMEGSVLDPARDEELFALGIRRLVRSFTV